MTRTVKWMGVGIGGLLLLAVLAVVLLPPLVNLERYRTLLAQRVGRSLGREVTLGALRVSLWGGVGAEATSIHVGQASGFGAEPFLSAEALRIHVQLLPLLRGQVKVTKDDKLLLEIGPAGYYEWQISDTEGSLTESPGARTRISGIGGQIGLTYVPWDLVLNFRGFYEYHTELSVQGWSFSVNLIKKL